jgi:hypothetical protein
MHCSKSALLFLCLGIAAFLWGGSVTLSATDGMGQLYAALWFNITAIFWVGAGVIAKLQHLVSPEKCA